ncbi:MAG: arginine decarboxylase [Lachnospiraceae bacterium]|nr:arginine decarboxylase [Lachnospiraceae bacterium]
MKKYICEGLAEYLSMDRKPWHMPGHKRKNFIKELDEKAGLDVAAFLSCDVTEVSDTDDLHHPEEMILKSQQQLARIYDSYASFYMVNGSTGGILSAIGAVAEYGKEAGKNKIIIARNCHKSVYNGVKLFGLEPIYVEPEYMELEEGYISNIYSGIKAHQIKALVEQHQNVCAVVITSPTYEGVVSDVSGIRKVLKPRGIPFIVDEAHGAHLSFIDGIFQLPLSAVSLGADIVVQSLHKTLPALTQTAVLHINDERFETGIRKYLSIFMSSSPSYPMLCSMEEAVVGSWEIKQRDGYEEYLNILRTYRENISKLKNIKLLEKTNCDETRIVLYGNWSGEMLAERLRELGNIEIEMSGVNYVVLISTYVDEPEDFAHLERTIKLLDEELDKWESVEATFSEEQLYELVGKVAIDNIYVYPPGSYIVAAGEEISKEAVDKIMELKASGKRIVGL